MIQKNAIRVTFKAFALLFLSFTLLTSCEKDDGPSTPTENQQTQNNNGTNNQNNNTSNVLCDGNGSNSYFPLKIGNKWAWKPIFGSKRIKAEVTEKIQINNKDYYKVEFKETSGGQVFWEFNRTLREENGTIYYAIETSTGPGTSVWTDYVWIPGAPQPNQSWEVPGLFNSSIATYKKEVGGTNATVTTNKCTYTNGVLIRNKSTNTSTGAVTVTGYQIFKKGIGIVNYGGEKLYEVTLN